MKIKSLKMLTLVSVVLISLGMHFNHFRKDLMSFHVWRQTQTQTTIDNFYKEDMNILHPRINDRGEGDGIFRMEFPLEQWLVACLYKVFGQDLIITRIFMFVTGLFAVWGMYHLFFALFRIELPALAVAWAFNFSPSFYYYTINPLPDNLALCLSIWGMRAFFYWVHNRKMNLVWISGLLLATGALCKLPFILYFSVPVIYSIFQKYLQKNKSFSAKAVFLHLLFLILPLSWYGIVIPHWSNGIVTGVLKQTPSASVFFDYQC